MQWVFFCYFKLQLQVSVTFHRSFSSASSFCNCKNSEDKATLMMYGAKCYIMFWFYESTLYNVTKVMLFPMKECKHLGMTTNLLPLWLAAVPLKQQHINPPLVFWCIFFFYRNSLLLSCKDGWQKENLTKQKHLIYSLCQSWAVFSLYRSPTSSSSPACKGRTQSAKSTGGKFQSYTREYIQYRYMNIYSSFSLGLQLQFLLFPSCRFTTFRNDKLPHESKDVELLHHVTETKRRAVSECRRVLADRDKSFCSNPLEGFVEVCMDLSYAANNFTHQPQEGTELKTEQTKETFKTSLEETGLNSASFLIRWVSNVPGGTYWFQTTGPKHHENHWRFQNFEL